MSLLFGLGKAFFAGLVLFFAVPIATRPLEWEQKEAIIETYTGMAMSAIGRGLLLKRAHGGLRLVSTSFDSRINGEMARIGGEVKHWRDPRNYMSTMYGRPFGLAHEKKNAIINARVAHLGRLYREYHQKNEWEIKGHRRGYFVVQEGISDLVDIADALPIIQGSASPGLADRIDTFVEKGQAGYNSSQVIQTMAFIFALGAGFGLMVLSRRILQETGGAAGGAIPI